MWEDNPSKFILIWSENVIYMIKTLEFGVESSYSHECSLFFLFVLFYVSRGFE